MSKRILIITYYWPPAGGAGVQRWLKFVKFLAGSRWEPVVYTVENGEFPVLDTSLEKEVPDTVPVIRRKIREPYLWYKKITGGKKEDRINTGFLSEREKPKLAEKISVWIRGNFFIPDARKYWIKPSIRFLTAWLGKNPVDTIISTGPPHSMHLIALGLKNNLKLPWIADFRDPWTKIDFYEELMLSGRANRKHHALEQMVIQYADIVLSVNRQMIIDFNKISPGKTIYLPNGFDPDDFEPVSVHSVEKFTIVYAGSLTPSRNPEYFWQALRELLDENQPFANRLLIRLIGKADISARKSIAAYQLTDFTEWVPYQSHKELIQAEQRASLLLLVINRGPNARGIVTGKLFEYLKAERPILCLGPKNGEAAEIIRKTESGETAEYHDTAAIKKIILKFFTEYQKEGIHIAPKNTDRYSRKVLTDRLLEILDQLNHKKNQT